MHTLNPVIAEVYHGDVDTGVFFERALEFIKRTAYQTQYPDRKAMSLIPVSTEAGEGATHITYQLWDEHGVAKLLATMADDIPRIDVDAKEFTSPIKPAGAAFGYTIDEIAAARMANTPLSQRKATATMTAFVTLVNKIAWNGNPATGIPGMFNNPNILTGTVPDGVSTTTPWSTKTPSEINEDLNLVMNAIITASFGKFLPDTILLPIAQFQRINSTKMSVDNPDTIRMYFLKNNPWIKTIDMLPELANGNNDVLSSDSILCYKKDPLFLTLEIPKMMRFEPIERRGLEFIISGHGRIGGTIIYQPLSVSLYGGL